MPGLARQKELSTPHGTAGTRGGEPLAAHDGAGGANPAIRGRTAEVGGGATQAFIKVAARDVRDHAVRRSSGAFKCAYPAADQLQRCRLGRVRSCENFCGQAQLDQPSNGQQHCAGDSGIAQGSSHDLAASTEPECCSVAVTGWAN